MPSKTCKTCRHCPDGACLNINQWQLIYNTIPPDAFGCNLWEERGKKRFHVTDICMFADEPKRCIVYDAMSAEEMCYTKKAEFAQRIADALNSEEENRAK